MRKGKKTKEKNRRRNMRALTRKRGKKIARSRKKLQEGEKNKGGKEKEEDKKKRMKKKREIGRGNKFGKFMGSLFLLSCEYGRAQLPF